MEHESRPATTIPGADMNLAKWIDVDGIRTRFFDEGEGDPIVFFHGDNFGACSSGRVWDLNFGPLSEAFNVIALDRLGQGFTDNPRTEAEYTMHASVEHAAAFLRLLGKGPYHIVGHSRGGFLVTPLAIRYPELVASLTCVSSATLSPSGPRNHIMHADLPAWDARERLRASYELYSYSAASASEDLIDRAHEVMQLEKSKAAFQKMFGPADLDRSTFLPNLQILRTEVHRHLVTRGLHCPTLVTWGKHDPGAPLENGKVLIEMFMAKQPRTEVCVFNFAGHFVFREYSRQFNNLLRHSVRSTKVR